MKKSLRSSIIAKAKPIKVRRVRERDIEAKIVEYAKAKGCLAYKFNSASNRGVCDRIIIAPGGAVLFLEVKRPKETPTKLQEKFLRSVSDQGAFSRWVDNVLDGERHVDEVVLEGQLGVFRPTKETPKKSATVSSITPTDQTAGNGKESPNAGISPEDLALLG